MGQEVSSSSMGTPTKAGGNSQARTPAPPSKYGGMEGGYAQCTSFKNLLGPLPATTGEPLAVSPQTLPTEAAKLNKLAARLEGALSEEECKRWIEISEKAGYEEALLSSGGGEVLDKEIRDSERCIIDDEEATKSLWERIKHALPEAYIKGWKPLGLNERLRFLKYSKPGQSFLRHYDGVFRRPGKEDTEQSKVTILLYLNGAESYTGCYTHFYEGSRYDRETDEGKIPITPATGMVLVMDHRILHGAEPLLTGTKYVLRTDVMYQRVSEGAGAAAALGGAGGGCTGAAEGSAAASAGSSSG